MLWSNVLRLAPLLVFGLAYLVAPVASAKRCVVEGVATYTGNVRDVLATPNALWVASEGGVEEFDRQSRHLLRKYTHLDGLSSLSAHELSRTNSGAVQVTVDGARCQLRGNRFVCHKASPAAQAQTIDLSYRKGARVTASLNLSDEKFVGTAGQHAFLNDTSLSAVELPDRHVTSLSVFEEHLWVGTFNGGLARQDDEGRLRPHPGPGKLVNALLAGPRHLFVGTSDGLYRTRHGEHFERVDVVEHAVVGLALDGTSVWATTPGAIYRIRDGKGPPSDVWWLPGGSRSLQKVSAVPGAVWFGTEDRGAVRMRVSPHAVSQDRPFEVFDRGKALPSSWSLAVAARPGGGAWMTTLREGVARIDSDGSFQTVETGKSSWGLSALSVPGGAWIGTQGGAAFVSDDGSVRVPIERLPDPRVHALLLDPRAETQGRLWIGTENGLAWCSPSLR